MALTTGQAVAVVTVPVATAGAVFLGYEVLKHTGLLAGTVAPRPPVVAPPPPPIVPPLVQGSNAANVAGVATALTGDVSQLADTFSGLFS